MQYLCTLHPEKKPDISSKNGCKYVNTYHTLKNIRKVLGMIRKIANPEVKAMEGESAKLLQCPVKVRWVSTCLLRLVL